MSRAAENDAEMAPEAFSHAASSEGAPVKSRPSWKQVALIAGGFVATAVGTVAVTLAATHNSARVANAAAYAHGLLDGARAARNGYDFDEDDD